MNQEVAHPDLHVHDLIGHSNPEHLSAGNLFQEQADLPSGYNSVSAVLEYDSPVITMEQRRALQILSARGEAVPNQWIKKRLPGRLKSIRYPLHFIDFEAASSLIPMSAGSSCYETILFQFSCHTLTEAGELIHTQWVDDEAERHPHESFVQRFLQVPDVEYGTFVQYSPFEKQSLNRLAKGLAAGKFGGSDWFSPMRRLITGSEDHNSGRFMDLSRLVRDYYYNAEMKNGLSLKSVFKGLLDSSPAVQEACAGPVLVSDDRFNLTGNGTGSRDPYRIIQPNGELIDHGAEAMHAWLYTKTGQCSGEKKEQIIRALKRYCSLDTLAMVILYRFWVSHFDIGTIESDIVVMQEQAHRMQRHLEG